MNHDTPEKIEGYHKLVGQKVMKKSNSNNKKTPKPFKSGFRVNTVKACVNVPETQHMVFLFEEDESFVRCYQCRPADNQHGHLGAEYGEA